MSSGVSLVANERQIQSVTKYNEIHIFQQVVIEWRRHKEIQFDVWEHQ